MSVETISGIPNPWERQIIAEIEEGQKMNREDPFVIIRGDERTRQIISRRTLETSLLAKTVQLCGLAEDQGTIMDLIDDEEFEQMIKALDDAALPTSVREENGSFQRASEEKLRTRRIVSVADRFRRSAAEAPPPSEPTTTAAAPDSAPSLADAVSQFQKAVSEGKYRA